MGCIGGGGGGLLVVLEFAGVTVEVLSGRGDGILGMILKEGGWAGLGWTGWVEVLKPVEGLI